MTDKELLNKAIYWFKVIAEDMERITTGNLPHCAATTKGRAIRAYEFLEKHKEEPVSEDLEETSKRYALNNTPYEDCHDEMQEAFKTGAKWQKEKIINKACDWLWGHTFDDNLIKDFRKNMEE